MLVKFRAGAIKYAETWRLENRLLTSPKGKEVDLRTVKKARLFQAVYNDMWAITLTLKTEDVTVSIGCNDGRYTNNKKQCLTLMMAVLAVLKEDQPLLRIGYGADKTMRYVLTGMWFSIFPFFIGLIVDLMKYRDNLLPSYFLISVIVAAAIIFLFVAAPWKDSAAFSPSFIEGVVTRHGGLNREALPHG